MLTRGSPWLRTLSTAAGDSDQFETTLRLTLVLLLLYGDAGETIGVRVAAAALLAIPPLLTFAPAWIAIALFAIGSIWRARYAADNHQFLICYWVIAIALTVAFVGEEGRARALRVTARALVAVIFLAASAWKFHGGEFVDGSFMHFTMLVDPRFQVLTAWLSGQSVADVAEGAAATTYLGLSGANAIAIPIQSSPTVAAFALGLSWAGMLGEGAIGVAHTLPQRYAYVPRLTLFWLFVATTYFLFPVMGFAFVLAILGYAQCNSDDRRGRIAFISLVAVIHLTLIPWQRLLLFR